MNKAGLVACLSHWRHLQEHSPKQQFRFEHYEEDGVFLPAKYVTSKRTTSGAQNAAAGGSGRGRSKHPNAANVASQAPKKPSVRQPSPDWKEPLSDDSESISEGEASDKEDPAGKGVEDPLGSEKQDPPPFTVSVGQAPASCATSLALRERFLRTLSEERFYIDAVDLWYRGVSHKLRW